MKESEHALSLDGLVVLKLGVCFHMICYTPISTLHIKGDVFYLVSGGINLEI